jgi:elongation factor Ts
MADITAKMVSDLRAATGMGMMECKKALVETEGDAAKAEELLRVKSGNKASKLAGRTAAEGVIGTAIKGAVGVMVEINCETDFMAKNDQFKAFVQTVADAIVAANPADVAALADVATASGKTVEETRKEAIAQLGENLTVRRFTRFETTGINTVYLHGSKIGVMVNLTGDEATGKDLAMHIAASKPVCISRDDIAPELLATETRIFTQQAIEEGKTGEMLDKVVAGRVNKYLAEATLLGQKFVKDDSLTIEKLLASKSAKVHHFAMYTVGEGIEKAATLDYAAEVAAAAAAAQGK